MRVLRSVGLCYNLEFNWLRTAKALSMIRIWTKRSGSNRTWIPGPVMGPSYIYFCNISTSKLKFVFQWGKSGTRPRMVIEKCDIIKLWHFAWKWVRGPCSSETGTAINYYYNPRYSKIRQFWGKGFANASLGLNYFSLGSSPKKIRKPKLHLIMVLIS
jgi:hypothetical protein